MRRILSQRRSQAPAPPERAPAEVEALERAPADRSFVTGNGFASLCRHVLNYDGASVNEGGREGWYFCRRDVVQWFFEHHAPRDDFVLVTHNSDYPVDLEIARHLRRRRLRAWFAANVALRHAKLHPIPLGIANPHWPEGDTEALRRVRDAALPKTRLFDTSYAIETNERERRYCVEQTGLEPPPRQPFGAYLEQLASAYFCIAPRGNGLDTHRTWEALYVGTIPVVTRSPLTDSHPDLPLVVLDDWSEFRGVDFSPDLYRRVWGSWSPNELSLERYAKRLDERLRRPVRRWPGRGRR
jgi:hypothetical protein